MNLTNPSFVVTLFDENRTPIGIAKDFLSCEAEFNRQGFGPATIVLKGSDPLTPLAMRCVDAPVPVTIDTGTKFWRGHVTECEHTDVEGAQTFTLLCAGMAKPD